MKIRESAEDYLETILVLKKTKGAVRSVDIAHYMGYSKPSVSRAVGLLKEHDYITVGTDGWVELTEAGQKIAEQIFERHEFFAKWLVELGVEPDVAAQDACRIEHYLSEETFEKIKEYIQKH